MRGVKSLEDFLRAGRERSIAQQKSQAAMTQILFVSRHDFIRNEYGPRDRSCAATCRLC